MSGEVTFHDEVAPRFEGTLGQAYDLRTPLDALLEKEEMDAEEEGDEHDQQQASAWVLSSLLELVFADRRPMDWRYAAARGLVMIRSFAPGLLVGRPVEEVREMENLVLPGTFPPGALMFLGDDPMLQVRRRKLLGWIFEKSGKGWLKAGTMRLYFLARGCHGQVLKRLEPAKWVGGVFRREREVDMTFADFGEAFGEKGGESSRARWCWREKQALKGLPHLPTQKDRETVERNRAAMMGNRNRIKNRKQEKAS